MAVVVFWPVVRHPPCKALVHACDCRSSPLVMQDPGDDKVSDTSGEAPYKTSSKRRLRQSLLIMMLLSLAPYCLPLDEQPEWYHDGMTRQELRDRAAVHRLQVQIYDSVFGKIEDFF